MKRVAALLLTMLMLVGCLPLAFAEGSGLMPDPVHYTNGKEVTDGSTGDIVLSKTAERIGPDEWKVKVEAEIERTVGRPQPNLELVVVLDKSGSMAWCTDEFAHAAGSHSEHSVDNGCYTLICTNTGGGHRHSVYNGCYELNCTRPFVKHTTSGNTLCSYRQGSNWVNYTPNRLAVAKSNITSLVNSLNASNNIEEKEIEYVVFSDNAQKVTNLNNVQARGGTSMYTGIQKGLTLFDQDDSYRKILIVVTDGEASDGDLKEHTLELLDEAKEEKNIAVFTVGFSYENEDLSAIAGNGGSYVHAGNQVELEKAFQGIEETIRAMMVDPMGTTVGFDSSSFDVSTSEVKGNVSYVGNTLYWNPVGDSVPAGSKVSYSYTVKLNHKADTSRGSHTGVALNAPTDFLYSITNGTTVSHYAVGFPIPEASYKISTLKERWVNEYNRSILSDSDEEKIITDYSKTTDDGVHKVYTPAFTTDYNHPVQSIPVTSSNSKFYLYKYSTVTKNNVALENGVDDIKPKNEAAAYVVTHHYEKVDGYKVSYTYEGEVPDTAVAASSFNTMAQAGATVQVAENPSAGGYRFLGWECETSDVSVSGGAFTMPSKHVSFVGKWEKVHSYQVNANYFYVIDGDYSMPMQENTSEILLEHVNCENGNTTSYTHPVDAFIYNDNTYTSVQLGSAVSGVTISDNVINGIVPGSGTVPKIVVNLYRDIKRDYELNVKHVFKDNTTHEGYPFAYPDVGSKYQYDQPWDVSNLGAPEGYALVVSESGVATSATNDTLMKARVLKEDTFGKADKYVILTYEKLPMYQVTIHFVSEEPTKARLIAEDYVSDPAYAGTTYDVRAQLPSYIEDGDVFWYYSGDESLSGDPLTDTLDSNKDITAKYYLNPTYTIAATYTTVTDGVSSSEVVTSSGKDEVDVPVPFTQSDYDNMVSPFTEKHFQNDLKVNGVDATTMPTMEKFGHYEVTLSYLRQVNNPYRAVVKYQDQNGNELKDPATSDEIAFGQSYNMETAKLETIVADGVKYLFVSDDTDANNTAYFGNMPKGGVEIIRTYQPAPKYTVTYQYSNTFEGAPTLPVDENTYYEGEIVAVKDAVSKEGYTFSGWSTTDATIADGKLSMPGKNVVLVGSWTKKPSYQVIVHYYTITDGVKASTPDQTVDTGIQYCDTTSPVTVPYETTVSSVEYSSPKLAENTAGATLDKTNRQVINITPVTETAKVVVELTRTVTSSAEYKV
ncbi:MAG: InlB B-repeat-containing protein, partial [Clostridia bacterium]|nr:InlB B-repeat-containing protein [Clostridia bacterium]